MLSTIVAHSQSYLYKFNTTQVKSQPYIKERLHVACKKRKVADKTRNKIMAATVELFVNQGFSGTSMQAIADKAGLKSNPPLSSL